MHAHKMKKVIFGSAISALLLAGCSGSDDSASAEECDPKFEFSTIAEGTLTISTYDGLPYFGQNDDGTTEGIDAAFLEQFAADNCLEPEWVVAPAASVIQAVASGRADIAAGGWYATDERAEIVDQSDSSYIELPTIFAKEATSRLQDLEGQSVGTISGFTWVPELKEVAGDLKEYQSADATLQDLAADRIDFAVLGGIDAPYMLTQNETFADIESRLMDPDERVSSSVNPALPNYPHTKGNTELGEALNEALAEARENGTIADNLEEFGLDTALADTEEYEN